jgi:hypothetical protein
MLRKESIKNNGTKEGKSIHAGNALTSQTPQEAREAVLE